MSLFRSYLWNLFLWSSPSLFAAIQVCSAGSSPGHSSVDIDHPSTRVMTRSELKEFLFETLAGRVGRVLYNRDPALMRWELEIRQVGRDRNGEIEIAGHLRQVGRSALPVTLRSFAGWGSEGKRLKEVLDRTLQEYNRSRRGRRDRNLQIPQESVVVVSYYFGGKNKITKEFYFFVSKSSSEINLWVVSRSGMGNEKFEGGRLDLSRTRRSFEESQGDPGDPGDPGKRGSANQQVARFSDSALASYVGKFLVNSGRDQVRLVLHPKEITKYENGESELKAGIGLAGSVMQDIEFRPLRATGELYDTYIAYYNEELLKKRRRNLGFVDREGMIYVGELSFGGRDQLRKIFYLIVEWPTSKIKVWVVSKKGSEAEKIEKVSLRELLDGCQEFLSNENEKANSRTQIPD